MLDSVLAYVKAKLDGEKVVLVGAAASAVVALAGKYGVVISPVALQEVLLPLATALIARCFATSKGVTPGL